MLIFPTRVGVNRCHLDLILPSLYFPHTRGGEPYLQIKIGEEFNIFPTRVGVNRRGTKN